MDWGEMSLWLGSAALLLFAIITIVWAPGRRRDPGRAENRPPELPEDDETDAERDSGDRR